MAAIFSNPESFAMHVGKDILVNHVDIKNEVETAVSDYESKKWEDFGYQLGEASAKTLVGAELTALKKKYVGEVFKGLLSAFGGNFNLENLLFCIYFEDQAALMLDAAYQALEEAFKTKDWSNLIGALIGVIGAVQQFEQGLPACEAIDTASFNYPALHYSMDIAMHPQDHVQLLEDDL